MARTFALVGFVLVVISAYVIFQCSTVVSYNSFSRSIITATWLLNVEPLDVSPATLENGYFTSLLTFQNPTGQTLNMTKLEAYYYRIYVYPSGAQSADLVGLGNIEEPTKLAPGKTQVILQMDLKWNATFPQPSYWLVTYRLKFGSAHYSFHFEMHDSILETKGPVSIDLRESQAVTQIATWILIAVNVWAIGLEALAVLILVQERKVNGPARVPEETEHNKMLSVIYALQGFGLFIAPSFFTIINSVLSEPPRSGYYVGGGGPLAALLVLGLVYFVSLVFWVVALGLFLDIDAARIGALFLSVISVFVWLLGAALTLTHPVIAEDLALPSLFLAATAANIMAIYIILR